MSNKPDLKKPYTWLATWFGCGLLPKAPGTWGSLGALPVGIAIYYYLGFWNFVIGIILVTLIGYWAADRYDKAIGSHDNKAIVIDEVSGQWIALIPVFYFVNINPFLIFLAFLLFRVFDVLKPWPVSYLDKNVEGALGVMGDDVIAGLFAAGCLIGLIHAGLG